MQLLRSLFPNKILEMSGNSRRWIKSTPSPVVLREQVYRNCLSEVKSKRNGLVQQLRQGSPAIRNELLKSFVSEVYSATKLENSYIGESTHEMDYDGVDLDDLELLKQIADAIEYELETQRNNEIRLLELAEQEEFAAVSMYEEDINSIICPLCRNAMLVVSEATGTASCSCGALINLQVTSGLSPYSSPSSSQPQQEYPAEDNTTDLVITASVLKARLANSYDRHMVGCRYNDGVATNEVLEFQIYGGHLCAFCARCSFYEQIT